MIAGVTNARIERAGVTNARIERADISFHNGFALFPAIEFSFDGYRQGLGGYVLGGSPFDSAYVAQHEKQCNIMADVVGGLMAVAGVDSFSAMVGKIVRIRHGNDGMIEAIGHPIKDLWYEPRVRLELLKGRADG